MGKHIEVRPVRPVTTDDWVRGTIPEHPVLAPVAPVQEPAEMKRLTIDIPLAMHTRLKTECAANRQQIADVVRDLIAGHLKR
jgi:ParG